MDHSALHDFLCKLDPIESIQIKTNQNVNDFDGSELDLQAGEIYPRLPTHFFFHCGPIFLSKHHRFADMPVHLHSFIEMNYMYSGTCIQRINGQDITLHQGQICLMDTEAPHAISRLDKDDILINIIMKKNALNAAFLTRLNTTGIVSDFLINAISASTSHDRYIVFHSENHQNLQYILKNMMCEFFDPLAYSQEMVHHYLLIAFTELMRVYRHDINYSVYQHSKNSDLIRILQFIEENYRHCSLKSVAAEFNFNANYLGNMLKKSTGKTFIELVQSQRMSHAGSLLKHTNKTIEAIALEVGYESLSFFYKKFSAYFGKNPTQYRMERQPF